MWSVTQNTASFNPNRLLLQKYLEVFNFSNNIGLLADSVFSFDIEGFGLLVSSPMGVPQAYSLFFSSSRKWLFISECFSGDGRGDYPHSYYAMRKIHKW